MENLFYNISQVLGITIIHSLWQGLVVYFVFRFLLMLSGQVSASKKYTLAVVSLLAITAWFCYTLVNEISIYNWLATVPQKASALPLLAEIPAGIRNFSNESIRYYYSLEAYMPYVSALYAAGMLFNVGRLMITRKKINAIKHNTVGDTALQQTVDLFVEVFDITKNIKVGISKMIDVPCIVGYFKPMILLPFALSTYLSTKEIESILLHELAHIKRNDYLVNMIQQVIVILLFFNPCAHLIIRIINEERENCCDDLVVKAPVDPLNYAKALLKLEQTRQTDWTLALAATGKKHHLLNRIERIMKTKKQLPSLRPTLLATLILTVSIGAMALLKPEVAEGKISVKTITPIIDRLLADTGKKAVSTKKAAVIKKKETVKAKTDAANNNDNNHEFAFSYDNHYDDKWDFKDPELDRLSKEVEKHGNAISKYYESGAFKKTQEEIEAKGKEIQKFYDRPELKALQEKQQRAAENFEKVSGQPSEVTEMSQKMEKLGKKTETYYNSPEFKKINSDLEKKYGIPHEHNYVDDSKDENYRKYQVELKKNIPAEVQQATEDLKATGAKMRKHFHSPEYEKARIELRAASDSMRKVYHNPQQKQQQQEMRALSAKMREYSHSPEIEKEKAELKEATAKMHAYMRTPDFKERLKEYRDTHPGSNWSDDQERPEKPGKPEKLEKLEKLERPNKLVRPEKLEKLEKPEKLERPNKLERQ